MAETPREPPMSVRFSKTERRRIKTVTRAHGNGDTPHNYVIRAVLAQVDRDEAAIRRRKPKSAPIGQRKR